MELNYPLDNTSHRYGEPGGASRISTMRPALTCPTRTDRLCYSFYGRSMGSHVVNTLRPRQNGRHFTDGTFKCIFLYEIVWIPIWISLTFVPKGQINNIPALVQIMDWRRPGDKPLSEPMMVRLPTPQWVNKDFHFMAVVVKSLDIFVSMTGRIFGDHCYYVLLKKRVV